MKTEVLCDTKFNGLCSNVFYGKKKKSVTSCYKNKDILTESFKNSDKHRKGCMPKQPFYTNEEDVYWTTNLYRKSSCKDAKHLLDNQSDSCCVDTVRFVASIGSQTSFSSSQESSANTSPAVCSFRVSPLLDENEQEQEHSCSSPDLSERSLVESLDLTDEKSFFKGTENSPVDCLNLSTSSSLSHENLQSPKYDRLAKQHTKSMSLNDSMSSSEKSPKKNTILNYFKNCENGNSKHNLRSTKVAAKSFEVMTSSTTRQLTLTSEKLTELHDRMPFSLLSSPRQRTGVKRASEKNDRQKDNKRQRKEQTYIDIGQKDFGHVTCLTCGMVYTKAQIDDEAQHAQYHQKVVQKLRFNGWKNERVLQEFHDGRIIVIHSSDHHLHIKKLLEVRDVVDSELGFNTSQDVYSQATQQAYLFISKKKVLGCAIALPIKKAYTVILTDGVQSQEKESGIPTSSWCCSSNPVPALCGISRIWVFSQNRRQKIASRIADCIRHHFLYGCVIAKNKLAFSDPTPNGRIFAEKYVGKEDILIFR